MAGRRRKAERPVAMHIRIAPALRAALDQIKERDGIPLKVQLERAVKLWAESKGLEAAS